MNVNYSFSLTPVAKSQAIANPLEVRQKILGAELAMLADPERYDPECKAFAVRHFKAPGMIGRQMLLPKGGEIIGKIHKHAHLNQISYGHVCVVTEDGPMEIKGPYTFTSQPGTKRYVLALEDTLWTTFHLNPNDLDPDNEVEMKQFEDEIIAKNYDELQLFLDGKKALEVAK